MKETILCLLILLSGSVFARHTPEKPSYHPIQTDVQGKILPWFDKDPGKSYDHIIGKVWSFRDTIRPDLNGLPYYMNHQVWKKDFNDSRGIGRDQIPMALSSWRVLYAYTGNVRILNNMLFQVDYYLSHSLSPADCKWKNLPFPYNTLIYSGIYDGDMIVGKGFTQPDKAGSFGCELINIYKLTEKSIYPDAAVGIANTLSENMVAGDKEHSPLPFRVNAFTGQTGMMNEGTADEITYAYTSDWVGTMKLFSGLITLGKGNTSKYERSFKTLPDWMQKYPLKENKWGPFFEDVGTWSDTQINAITFAQYILENPSLFPDWKVLSRNSMNWYMVNDNGESTYPNGETWMTDRYGDFVRHYLNAMAAFPELAPADQNHLVRSTSVIREIVYTAAEIRYKTFDNHSTEVLRLKSKPTLVQVGDIQLTETDGKPKNDQWLWVAQQAGGVLKIEHENNNKISIHLTD